MTALALAAGPALPAFASVSTAPEPGKTVTLRVCNWEEYIDTGDWGEEETIDLPSGDIRGDNSMVEDFEQWYYETYGVKVKVEYSTFGTNEDLYNMLTLGDTYDLICPSEYMFMKLMDEGQLVPLSDHFFDTADENNYYIRGVSPYLENIFQTQERNGEPWAKYAAGYMWGVTGIVYNPDVVAKEEASTWKILSDPKFYRQVTIKDNVRDSYFAAVGAIKSDLLTSSGFLADPDYHEKLEEEMNDTSPEMVQRVQDWLQGVKDNVYSFETDSGKADMITGKVVANYQWSGDAVYTMDQADEDGYTLNFAVRQSSRRQRPLSTSSPGRTTPSETCITSATPPSSPAGRMRGSMTTSNGTTRRRREIPIRWTTTSTTSLRARGRMTESMSSRRRQIPLTGSSLHSIPAWT